MQERRPGSSPRACSSCGSVDKAADVEYVNTKATAFSGADHGRGRRMDCASSARRWAPRRTCTPTPSRGWRKRSASCGSCPSCRSCNRASSTSSQARCARTSPSTTAWRPRLLHGRGGREGGGGGERRAGSGPPFPSFHKMVAGVPFLAGRRGHCARLLRLLKTPQAKQVAGKTMKHFLKVCAAVSKAKGAATGAALACGHVCGGAADGGGGVEPEVDGLARGGSARRLHPDRRQIRRTPWTDAL